MSECLVLDVAMQPVSRVPWETAIVWVLDRVVRVVDEHPDKYIRTVSWQVRMPSIVQFLKPIPRKRAIKFSRQNVYLRDKGRCQYCGLRVSRNTFTYDHVIPRSQGGTTKFENVVCACSKCNLKKGGRTPPQAGMRLLTKPVRPKSLPDGGAQIFYEPGMPSSWADYLRDAVYWNSELETD